MVKWNCKDLKELRFMKEERGEVFSIYKIVVEIVIFYLVDEKIVFRKFV